MREWLKLMLEEIRRREDDERRARQEPSGPAKEPPPVAPRTEAPGQDRHSPTGRAGTDDR